MGRSRRLMGMPFAAVALLGAGVLAGCQSAAAPPVASASSPGPASSSASPSASSSPSPSASASVDIPAAAREKSEKGAEAFVRYFVRESARSWVTADPQPIEVLSDTDCESCDNLASTAQGLAKKGHRYADTPITVVSTEPLTGDGSRQNVFAIIKQHAVDVVDGDGSVVSTDRADELERTFLLYWKEGRWLVGGIA